MTYYCSSDTANHNGIGRTAWIESDFVPLDLSGLRDGLPPSCDLYVHEGGQYVLYREASLPFTPTDCDRLMGSGVSSVWIRISTEDGSCSPRKLLNLLALSDEQLPRLAKARLLYGSTVSIARGTANHPVSSSTLGSIDEMVSLVVDHLAESPTAFYALVSVMVHSFSVYTHAVNVATYALGLGRYMGVTDKEELRNLGLGALLHDVGKSRVPESILNKPEKLSADEWVIMRQHPSWGKESLSLESGMPEEVLTIVGQHHERLDGSGYPYAIGGSDLCPSSMIVALVDSFDAMTSYRPYRNAWTPYQALAVLKTETVNKLDPDLFAGLVLVLGQPVMAN